MSVTSGLIMQSKAEKKEEYKNPAGRRWLLREIGCPLMHEGIFDFIDCHLQCLVVAHFFRDFFAGMDDCGMIPTAKQFANFRQR